LTQLAESYSLGATSGPGAGKGKREVRILRITRFIEHFLILALVLAFLVPPPLLAQQARSETEDSSGETDKPAYPEKVRSRAAWEYIVNIPGYILYLPFFLVYSATSPLIGWAEKSNIVPRVNDFLTSDDGKRRAFPIFETQYGAGLGYRHKDLFKPGCELKATGMVGLWWKRYLALEMNGFRLAGPLDLGLGAHSLLLSDAAFYGLGNGSSKENRTNFAHRQPAVWASLGIYSGEKLNTGLVFRYEQNSISEGRNPNYPSTTDWPDHTGEPLPGLSEKSDFLALEFNLDHFSLFQRQKSAGGWVIGLKAGMYNQLHEDTYNFYKGFLDVKRYIHLFYGRTLSLRFATEITRPLKDGEIPFYYLSRLGQRKTIRGYFRDRFRDRDSVLFSVEYRYPLIKRPSKIPSLDALLFIDSGKVYHDVFAEDFFSGFHTSFGGGFRIYNRQGMDLEFYLAKSKDGFRFYLVWNEF